MNFAANVCLFAIGLSSLASKKPTTKRETLRMPKDRFKTAKIIASVLASIVSVGLAFWPGSFWETPNPACVSTRIRAAVLVLWAVGAPLWFMIDYHFFDDSNDTAFGRFKYEQSLAAKLWAGMTAALTVLYFGKGIFEHVTAGAVRVPGQ